MIYTKMTKLAMRIAYNAHNGQMDKSGVPYIFHPIHLAESMVDEDTTIVALLHDVVEDTHVTMEEVYRYGFNDSVIEALKLLTHNDGSPYMEYIEALKNNRVARTVKIADLMHNCDTTRMDNISDRYLEKHTKYVKALQILKEVERMEEESDV